MKILEILIAILIPPLAVFLRYGFKAEFFINLLLTVLGYIPGLIHAIYTMSKQGAKS